MYVLHKVSSSGYYVLRMGQRHESFTGSVFQKLLQRNPTANSYIKPLVNQEEHRLTYVNHVLRSMVAGIPRSLKWVNAG
jgi:hypothetical protein